MFSTMPHAASLDSSDLTTSGQLHDVAADHDDYRAEAARYAVLLRVAPMLRHDLAGAMQPIGMIAVVLQRRLQMPEPDLTAIGKNVTTVGALVKEASSGCLNAMGWLAPREDAAVEVEAGVADIIKLLVSSCPAAAWTLILMLRPRPQQCLKAFSGLFSRVRCWLFATKDEAAPCMSGLSQTVVSRAGVAA